jgi:hypothetical protein
MSYITLGQLEEAVKSALEQQPNLDAKTSKVEFTLGHPNKRLTLRPVVVATGGEEESSPGILKDPTLIIVLEPDENAMMKAIGGVFGAKE